MAIAMLLPSVFPKWFTPAGDSVLSGGFLEFYEVGTTTPKSVYADYQQNAPIGNVVTLDGAGDATIFLGAGGYKVILKDQLGAQLDLVDGIFGSGGVGAIPSTANYVLLLNYDELRALSTTVDVAYVAGRTNEGDGGEGWFQRLPGVTAHDDDGVFLSSVGGSIQYRRIFDAAIDPRWYGVEYGSSADQKDRLEASFPGSAETGCPVLVSKQISIGQSVTVPVGAVIECSQDGSFYGANPVSMAFEAGSRFSGIGACFIGSVQPVFVAGTISELRLSWFGGADGSKWTRAIASTSAKVAFKMDVSTSVTSSVAVPSNLPLTPENGAILTFAAPGDLSIGALDHSTMTQFVAYGAAGHIQSVLIGSPVCYMEWFGGSASNSGDDNAIPFKACCAAKRLDLREGFLNYTVTSSNSFTISDFVSWHGNNSKITLNQSITVMGIYLYDIQVWGSGSITHSSCIAYNANVTVPLLSGPVVVNNSSIDNPDWVIKADNSSIYSPKKISGKLNGCQIVTDIPMESDANIFATSCKIQKTGFDPVFVLIDDDMVAQFMGCLIQSESTFIYSSSPLNAITIEGCTNPEWSNGQAIHNGIATVHISGCGVPNNPSATSIDGFSLDADTMLHITDDSTENVVVSSDASKWRASVPLSSDGEYITIGSDMILGSNIWSIDETVRAIALAFFDTAWRYGGVIETEIIYPIGHATSPADQVVAAFVHPPCANVATPGVNAIGDGGYYCCEPVTLGESLPINPPQKTSTRLKFRTNVWGGQVDLRAIPESHATYNVSDIWGDRVTSVPDNTNSVIQEFGRFVIYNKTGTSILPAGTKIKVTYRYDLPNKDQFLRFFRNEYAVQNILSSFYQSAPATYQAVRVRCALTGSHTGQTQLSIPFMFRDSDFNGVQASLARRQSDNFTPVQWNGSTLTVGWS